MSKVHSTFTHSLREGALQEIGLLTPVRTVTSTIPTGSSKQCKSKRRCFCFAELDEQRAISARPRAELHLFRLVIATPSWLYQSSLNQKRGNEFHQPSFYLGWIDVKEKIFCTKKKIKKTKKYTCRHSIHIFPSVPDFMKPSNGGEKKHRGSYFLFLCFLPLCLRMDSAGLNY